MDDQKTLPEEKKVTASDVLITGGHGLLGTKLGVLLPGAHRPTRSEMDIRYDLINSPYMKGVSPFSIKTVIHCAALKNEPCTKQPLEAMMTNIVGTANVVLFCHVVGAKLVYISTDYVFRGDRGNYKVGDEVGPVNYYAETKLAGEYVVKSLKDYLIIRLSFFPDVFPYEQAFLDQYATRITVTEAASRICELISSGSTGIRHIAGPKRSIYEYALATAHGKPVKPIYLIDDPLVRPKDTSLVEEL